MNDIYTTLTLSDGRKAVIIEGRGEHVMLAMMKAGIAQANAITFFLICELTSINGKNITIEELKALCIGDTVALANVISTQMERIDYKP